MMLRFTYIPQNHVLYSLFVSSIYNDLLRSVPRPPEWPNPFESGYTFERRLVVLSSLEEPVLTLFRSLSIRPCHLLSPLPSL